MSPRFFNSAGGYDGHVTGLLVVAAFVVVTYGVYLLAWGRSPQRPNGISVNGVAVWLDNVTREESFASTRFAERAGALLGGMFVQSRETEWNVVISHVTGGEIARSG